MSHISKYQRANHVWDSALDRRGKLENREIVVHAMRVGISAFIRKRVRLPIAERTKNWKQPRRSDP